MFKLVLGTCQSTAAKGEPKSQPVQSLYKSCVECYPNPINLPTTLTLTLTLMQWDEGQNHSTLFYCM